MLGTTFERLFERLVAAFKRYNDAPRSPSVVVELGTARWDLHLARNDMAEERDRVLRRPSPQRAVGPRTDVTDDDLARLRVFGVGYVEG